VVDLSSGCQCDSEGSLSDGHYRGSLARRRVHALETESARSPISVYWVRGSFTAQISPDCIGGADSLKVSSDSSS
jgi:hypothetical protein